MIDVLHCGKDGERYFEKIEEYLKIGEHDFGAAVVGRLESRR